MTPGAGGVNLIANTVIHAALGGLGSMAGGGKFANGAETGAFGYLFNYMRELPQYMKNFYDNYDKKLTDIEIKLSLCHDCLAGLSAHESTYATSDGAIYKNNIFGLDCCNGTKIIPFKSTDDSITYWENKFGSAFKGDMKIEDFIKTLHVTGYNSKDPGYDQKMRDQIDSVRHYEDLWKNGK